MFEAPRTRNGAVITGCKNLSRARALDEHHVLAEDWGMRLKVPAIPADLRYVGIRMHDILPGGGENTLRAKVLEVVENPFSRTLFLQTEGMGAGQMIGWELGKTGPRLRQGETVTISVPGDKILLLAE